MIKTKTKYTQEQIDRVVELHLQGVSSRKICDELDLPRSRKSSINYIIADFKKGNTVQTEADEDQQLEVKCNSEDWNVSNLAKRLRAAQRDNTQLRKIQREMFDECDGKNLQDILKNAVKDIDKADKVKVKVNKSSNNRMTAEVLLSDIQYAKLLTGYNTEIAKKRVAYYCQQIIERINLHQNQGVVFDEIIVGIIGDIIESDKKWSNSARACDTGTAEQLKDAVENLFLDFITPLAEMGIPMNIICVTGNHDHDAHGIEQYMPGKTHLSYPLYHSLRMLCETKGYVHVKFDIPEGCFAVRDIYGFGVIYEHGVGVSVSETSLTKRLHQRSDQLRKHLTYFRMGDKHSSHRFNEDTKVVNSAFFGGDDKGTEYSSINGYCSDPSQTVIFHTPRADARLSVCDSMIVQLKHVI